MEKKICRDSPGGNSSGGGAISVVPRRIFVPLSPSFLEQGLWKDLRPGWEVHFKLIYSHFHNILRLCDVLPNFPFTTSETMIDCY